MYDLPLKRFLATLAKYKNRVYCVATQRLFLRKTQCDGVRIRPHRTRTACQAVTVRLKNAHKIILNDRCEGEMYYQPHLEHESVRLQLANLLTRLIKVCQSVR